MSKEKNTIVLLDMHALIHRSYHALPELTNAEGEPIGAVYGVSSVLLKLIRELKPTHLAAAFDLPEPTFRHIAYEQYKAHREKAPDELIKQFEKARDIVRAFNIPIYEAPGFEADDIIGTLADLLKKEKGTRVIIASGDLDTLQLVEGEKVTVYTLRKGIQDTIIYDEQAVMDRFGFSPSFLADFKGLKGDPSDNIIGIKGIGEKTAARLVGEYGSLENFYTKTKDQKPEWLSERLYQKLCLGREDAFFSKELALIRKDAPIRATLSGLTWSFPKESVKSVFMKLNFKSLLSRLPDTSTAGGELLADSNDPKTETAVKAFSADKRNFQLDIASAGAVSVYMAEDGAAFFLCDERTLWRAETSEKVIFFRTALEHIRKNPIFIGHDLKGFFRFLLRNNIPLPETYFDTMVAFWVLYPDVQHPKLFDLSDRFLFQRPDTDARHAILLPVIERKLRQELEKAEIHNVYFDMELPLIPVLAMMEEHGVEFKAEVLHAISKDVRQRLYALEREIFKLAGVSFNIQSPKQLSELLFSKLRLESKGIRKTAETKAPSTRNSELAKLKEAHPIVSKIISFRELSKLLSTYIETLPKLVGSDGRIHTQFNQTGTVTGRLSSKDPNLQNIPIRTNEGEAIRRAFVAKKGYEFVAFDYSQIELRIAASFAGDEVMMNAFKEGKDIHRLTAAAINHIMPEEVTPLMRRRAKTINFGILYGMGENALSELIGVTRADARAYLDAYFRNFKGIAQYIKKTKERAREKGYVETLYGRRRYLPGIRSKEFRVVREAERMAVNAPVQGTGADIIKHAMLAIEKEFRLLGGSRDVRMLLQIHDDLLFEIRKGVVVQSARKIKDIMETAAALAVPLVVEVKRGVNWTDMKELRL
ncbi:MAG: DNA polymerase I [Candidatus Ryanbacteria bacterium RIFCSPHIGHO2_02_FULL_45_43]|uniref:DNA polymerase I n=1 Tax=Candidatus Ryanbacteria bacterium RIFCSPHIGHO2_01_45_13 TaxID=1802112 RepID=A0A1G2FXM4_9BACT|nr:MAG: DNA polymerase I [Candidatus Ryanbacteria bacterium RIFCSPHIGHO2_01_FULL_44_130]OGZ42819.1 MAG: DNA polymerase I [Candidatus Ryanbacteria bacterium RIFCSPHIGHO2_01_45_13]OGZ48235.1 MAG: DNA polymerase I [Candidatus Ryanbacteria bacterium RIFCSPHIGHO2_02_FULL_45_43]OGZ50011.1 MAG: DNA polymerase I [Candidatus Ryanbacteria bacterium RIFCSPHIGHO2_12_FULL_44_20]OGZ51470.1 MAG: DNA polymerase I [Candidatus Ryanbacteria bacterium RIFCSPLOWO2_01_FULL_44_230]OGZ54505.1 MAG: DNA polymerase I [C